jgi:hypothetical protein
VSDIFHSSKYSVERAKHHVLDLERQASEFLSSHAYTHVVEIDPNTSQKVYKLKLTKPMPVALSGIAFDAVNNLRSALDQAGYAIAIASAKKGKSAKFPFADDAAQLENVINRSCKDLPKEIVDLMRAFKPYKGGNNLLWALNKLCNTNKHAVICPVAATVGGIRYKRAVGSGGVSFLPPIWDRTKNEMELIHLQPGATADADIEIATFIAMRDVEFVDGQPADAILNQFVLIVERIVMAIEAEARRLGL